MEDRNDKFLQPVEAIEIVSRSTSPNSSLSPKAVEAARLRIAAGKDLDAVIQDVVFQEVWRTQDLDDDLEER